MPEGVYVQSNRRTRLYLDAVRDVVGRYGLTALLRIAELDRWIENPPPYDDELGVSYADFARLNEAMEQLYGPYGRRTLALRAGRVLFHHMARRWSYDPPPLLEGISMRAHILPMLASLSIWISRQMSGEVQVQEVWDEFHLVLHPSPEAWGYHNKDSAICYGMVGFLQQAVEWVGFGEYYHVKEVSCAATKNGADSRCVFALLRR